MNDPADDVPTTSARESETNAAPDVPAEPHLDEGSADQTVTRPPFGGDETVTSPRFGADETVVHPRSELFGFGTSETDQPDGADDPLGASDGAEAREPAEEKPMEGESPAAPQPAPDSDVFSYGDRTIFQLRAQAFAFESEYGTMMSASSPAPSAEGMGPLPETEPLPQDPIARLEQKLDLALRQIALLQQKIESIDATLARALNR